MSALQPPEFVQDDLLVAYLLGLLPDLETERLEELSIVDDEIAARLRVAEDELVDAYVTGTLTDDLRGAFTTHYLASPARRQKVAFARRLLTAVERAGSETATTVMAVAAVAPLRFTPRETVQPVVPSRSRARIVTWSAAALFLLSSGVVVYQSVWKRQIVSQVPAPAVSARAVVPSPALRVDTGAPAPKGNASIAAPAVPQAPFVVAVALLPQTRAAGPVTVVELPRRATAVRFDLRLESGTFDRYEVVLRDPATNGVRWRSGSRQHGARASQALSVTLPARLFKSQHYSLELAGRTRPQPFEVVGSYAFRIERR